MKKKSIFADLGETDISMAIVESFSEHLKSVISSDCVILGAGPSGLAAAKYLAEWGYKVVFVERNNYLGGGFWSGGYFMNKVTFRAPSQKILDKFDIPYKIHKKGLYISSAPLACSSLISASLREGVYVLNMTVLEDLVVKKDRGVCGVVINWASLDHLPREVRCLDPLALETKAVIDASGHEAYAVSRLAQRGLVKLKGEGLMWVEKSEELVVEKTSEIYPGLFVCGMSVAAVYGTPRMGPTFGAMLLSGEKVAGQVKKYLKNRK